VKEEEALPPTSEENVGVVVEDGDETATKKAAPLPSPEAEVVGQQYELVRRIMTHSSMPDLKAFSQVSSLWKSASLHEQTTAPDRMKPAAFSWQSPRNLDQQSQQRTKPDAKISVTRAVRENQEPALRSFHSALEEFVCKMSRMDPRLAVVFGVCEEGLEDSENSILDMSLVDKMLSCRSLSLGCRGIVTGQAEVENSYYETDAMELAAGILVFPAFKHVRITPFRIDEDTVLLPELKESSSSSDSDWDVDNSYGEGRRRGSRRRSGLRRRNRRSGETLTRSEYRTIFTSVTKNQVSLDDEEVKCCVMMEIYQDDEDNNEFEDLETNNQFLDSVLSVTNGQAAIGGCIGNLARDSKAQPDSTAGLPNRYSKAIGLVFSVPKAKPDCLRAYSVLLPKQARGEKAVKAALIKAKEATGFPGSDATSSCAFMFSCCARGENFHKRRGVELACFKEIFPNTAVTGLFVLGEIGHNYLGKTKAAAAQPVPNKEFNTGHHMRHQMCSMFVLLAFKQP